jgi:hypothetical protein
VRVFFGDVLLRRRVREYHERREPLWGVRREVRRRLPGLHRLDLPPDLLRSQRVLFDADAALLRQWLLCV